MQKLNTSAKTLSLVLASLMATQAFAATTPTTNIDNVQYAVPSTGAATGNTVTHTATGTYQGNFVYGDSNAITTENTYYTGGYSKVGMEKGTWLEYKDSTSNTIVGHRNTAATAQSNILGSDNTIKADAASSFGGHANTIIGNGNTADTVDFVNVIGNSNTMGADMSTVVGDGNTLGGGMFNVVTGNGITTDSGDNNYLGGNNFKIKGSGNVVLSPSYVNSGTDYIPTQVNIADGAEVKNTVVLGAYSNLNETTNPGVAQAVTDLSIAGASSLNIASTSFKAAGEDTAGQELSVMSVGGGQVNGKTIYRQIQNVAAGRISATSTDAVNGSQLHAVYNTLGNAIKTNSDRITQLADEVAENKKIASAGAAAGIAAASIPQVYKDGYSNVGIGTGFFNGQSAIAIGYSRASEDGRFIIRLNANANTQNDAGVGAGVSYQWK